MKKDYRKIGKWIVISIVSLTAAIIFLMFLFIFLLSYDEGKNLERINRENMEEIYPNGSFSVRGLLTNKNKYLEIPINVTGIVVYKYKCPSCIKLPFLNCAPCSPNHVILSDFPLESIHKNRIKVFFDSEQELYEKMSLSEKVTITIKYKMEPWIKDNGIEFVYN